MSAAARFVGLPVVTLPGGLTVHIADTARARRRGLARLDDLPAEHGLWLRPCRSVHMVGMRFALDLVWLDADEQVLEVVHDAGFSTRLRARSVIEVRAGQGDAFAAAWVNRAARR